MIQIIATLLGYLFLTIIMLEFLGLWVRRARFVARLLIFYTAMFGCTGYGVFATLLLRMVGKVSIAQYAVGRAFKHVVCPLIGVDIPVENEKALEVRPAVFISNHQSELDLVLLGRLFPKHCSVTAKRSLKYVPILGWFMALSGTVFIDRTNRKDAFTAFDRASQEMQEKKQSVWIFPEGTRSYSDTPLMLPFKKGAFHLALQAKVPIVPIVIANYAHVLDVKKMTFEKGTIPVRVLDPISVEGLTSADIPKLVEDTRKRMIEVLEEISPKKVEVKKSN